MGLSWLSALGWGILFAGYVFSEQIEMAAERARRSEAG